ncbi:hypothetical protein DPMN_130152 [Dreissena polymorpha]|uniref:Uncharacterized protein n=1 Tax=Dreissena polymorpha TaxID=45954 RepID=A0A9D4JXC0_DREPO|nr:hypothetical protein DPMN_130152 [Dreissena polymorpha]
MTKYLLSIRQSTKHLWSHIHRGPHLSSRHICRGLSHPGNPEITKPRVPVRVQENIEALQIAVYHRLRKIV